MIEVSAVNAVSCLLTTRAEAEPTVAKVSLHSVNSN